MKKLFLLLMLLPVIAFAQDVNKEQTKFEAFASPVGSIVKFYEVNLPNMPTNSSAAVHTCIRVVVRGSEKKYFYYIEKPETSSSLARIAMIEYSDLIEVNKAIQALVSEMEKDIIINPDYLENKFTSEDGFQIGYYISRGEARWFMKLEKYSSSNVYCRNVSDVVNAFAEAQKKIEELRQN